MSNNFGSPCVTSTHRWIATAQYAGLISTARHFRPRRSQATGSLDTVSGQDLLKLLRDLNHSQGTTFLIVTHDPTVARQTRRVVVMADGKIVREDLIGSPIEEDLKMWRHSGLGRRIVNGEGVGLEGVKISDEQRDILRQFLTFANGD